MPKVFGCVPFMSLYEHFCKLGEFLCQFLTCFQGMYLSNGVIINIVDIIHNLFTQISSLFA